MEMSEEGLVKLTQPWEEYVGYPYDDKRRKVRIDGKYVYPEWTGGKPRGTVTLGFGHTDEAGPIRQLGKRLIEPGMRLTEEQARELLLDDMAPVERMVNKYLKVEVTQHQYDCLADLGFNCPSAIPHVTRLVNAGKWGAAEKEMMAYIYSKGERMTGLVRRRAAEIAWANTHDDPEVAESAPKTPKAEKAPSNVAVNVGLAGGAVVAGGSGLVPTEIFHTHLFAGFVGALSAMCGGLIWNSRWRRS